MTMLVRKLRRDRLSPFTVEFSKHKENQSYAWSLTRAKWNIVKSKLQLVVVSVYINTK